PPGPALGSVAGVVGDDHLADLRRLFQVHEPVQQTPHRPVVVLLDPLRTQHRPQRVDDEDARVLGLDRLYHPGEVRVGQDVHGTRVPPERGDTEPVRVVLELLRPGPQDPLGQLQVHQDDVTVLYPRGPPVTQEVLPREHGVDHVAHHVALAHLGARVEHRDGLNREDLVDTPGQLFLLLGEQIPRSDEDRNRVALRRLLFTLTHRPLPRLQSLQLLLTTGWGAPALGFQPVHLVQVGPPRDRGHHAVAVRLLPPGPEPHPL